MDEYRRYSIDYIPVEKEYRDAKKGGCIGDNEQMWK
jgi:hypothetical protein